MELGFEWLFGWQRIDEPTAVLIDHFLGIFPTDGFDVGIGEEVVRLPQMPLHTNLRLEFREWYFTPVILGEM